ncbi:unnamed protein product [Meloidogyne enterolobii]|uniref:Uncharacterized protein n=1 Tax=Meloidogyne enterolobii TaxID=390850 RepID=A0ACB0Y6U6_MELEN
MCPRIQFFEMNEVIEELNLIEEDDGPEEVEFIPYQHRIPEGWEAALEEELRREGILFEEEEEEENEFESEGEEEEGRGKDEEEDDEIKEEKEEKEEEEKEDDDDQEIELGIEVTEALWN